MKKSLILIFSTFLSSFIVEQSAIINCILIATIIAFDKIMYKKKISKYLIYSFIAGFIGFLCIYLSPGCQNRIGSETTLTGFLLIKSNIKLILNMLFFYKPFQLLNFLISIFISFYLIKQNNNYAKKCSYINIISIFLFGFILLSGIKNSFFDFFNYSLIIKMLISLIIIIYLINLFWVSFIISKNNKHNNISAISFFIIAYFSQIPMLLVPTMGYRTVLITYLSLIIVFLSIIKGTFHLYRIRLNELCITSMLFCIFIIFIVLVGFFNYKIMVENYKKNSDILNNNSAILEAENKNNYLDVTNKIIELKKPPLLNYRWMYPSESLPHLYWYKLYYHIPDDYSVVFD